MTTSQPKRDLRGKAPAKEKSVQRRLAPGDRQFLIIEGAIKYFAEVGFEGQTRELSRRLGITNALLFRYFPTKEDLVERVYQQVYLGRWHPEWDELLRDRSTPLETRLRRFYKSYLSVIYTYDWVRIFFFAGLKGVNINDRYLNILGERVVAPICEEVRHAYGLPSTETVALTPMESDAVWGLQGQILYISVRRFIYNQPIADPEKIVDGAIEVFLAGISSLAQSASSQADVAKKSAVPAAKNDLRRGVRDGDERRRRLPK
jgi:AcrR family transcriptional regulator